MISDSSSPSARFRQHGIREGGVAMGLTTQPAAALPIGKCVNIGNRMELPDKAARFNAPADADMAWYAAAGFQTIRLPVRFDNNWNGQIQPDLLAEVDQIIAKARDLNLGVILDLHHFDALMADPDGHEDAFFAIWAELGRHYADHDSSLIFELLNEPRAAMTTQRVQALYDRVIPMLRERNPDRWIIIGGGQQYNLNEMLALPTPGPNIALTFHYYDPVDFTHQQADWTEETYPPRSWGSQSDRDRIWADMARAARQDIPIFLGEFGANTGAPAAMRADWTKNVRLAAESNGIKWCIWSDSSSFGIMDAVTREWNEGYWSALME